jgi:hypothetical protein
VQAWKKNLAVALRTEGPAFCPRCIRLCHAYGAQDALKQFHAPYERGY